jgi:hypothetical protein
VTSPERIAGPRRLDGGHARALIDMKGESDEVRWTDSSEVCGAGGRIDLGTPVVEVIGSEAKSRFTGRISKVMVQVK